MIGWSNSADDDESVAKLMPNVIKLISPAEADSFGSKCSTSMDLSSRSERKNVELLKQERAQRCDQTSRRSQQYSLLQEVANRFLRGGSSAKRLLRFSKSLEFTPLEPYPRAKRRRIAFNALKENVPPITHAKEGTRPLPQQKMAVKHALQIAANNLSKDKLRSRCERGKKSLASHSEGADAAKGLFASEHVDAQNVPAVAIRKASFSNQGPEGSHFSSIGAARQRGKAKLYRKATPMNINELQELQHQFEQLDEETLEEDEVSNVHMIMTKPVHIPVISLEENDAKPQNKSSKNDQEDSVNTPFEAKSEEARPADYSLSRAQDYVNVRTGQSMLRKTAGRDGDVRRSDIVEKEDGAASKLPVRNSDLTTPSERNQIPSEKPAITAGRFTPQKSSLSSQGSEGSSRFTSIAAARLRGKAKLYRKPTPLNMFELQDICAKIDEARNEEKVLGECLAMTKPVNPTAILSHRAAHNDDASNASVLKISFRKEQKEAVGTPLIPKCEEAKPASFSHVQGQGNIDALTDQSIFSKTAGLLEGAQRSGLAKKEDVASLKAGSPRNTDAVDSSEGPKGSVNMKTPEGQVAAFVEDLDGNDRTSDANFDMQHAGENINIDQTEVADGSKLICTQQGDSSFCQISKRTEDAPSSPRKMRTNVKQRILPDDFLLDRTSSTSETSSTPPRNPLSFKVLCYGRRGKSIDMSQRRLTFDSATLSLEKEKAVITQPSNASLSSVEFKGRTASAAELLKNDVHDSADKKVSIHKLKENEPEHSVDPEVIGQAEDMDSGCCSSKPTASIRFNADMISLPHLEAKEPLTDEEVIGQADGKDSESCTVKPNTTIESEGEVNKKSVPTDFPAQLDSQPVSEVDGRDSKNCFSSPTTAVRDEGEIGKEFSTGSRAQFDNLPFLEKTVLVDENSVKGLKAPTTHSPQAGPATDPQRFTRPGKRTWPVLNTQIDGGTEWKSGRRVSMRMKSKPLDWWRGERMLYGRVNSTMCTLIGIKTSSPDPVWPKPKPRRGEYSNREFYVNSFVDDRYKDLLRLAAQ